MEANRNMEFSWQKVAGTTWVHRLGAKHVPSAGSN